MPEVTTATAAELIERRGAGGSAAHEWRRRHDPLRDEVLAVLHDRRIPRSKAKDHLVVAPWGEFVVVDAKNYKGRVERRDRGSFFSTDYRLYVGAATRRRSSLA